MTHSPPLPSLLAAFRAEQAARVANINRGLAAAHAVLATYHPLDTISVPAFLSHIQHAAGIDRLTAQEIMHHLVRSNYFEETIIYKPNPDQPNVTLNRTTDTERDQRNQVHQHEHGQSQPSTQDDLFNPETAFITNHPCACCGNYTMTQPASGTYDMCPVCYWEDDAGQLRNPNSFSGINVPSLNHARLAYKRHGAMAANLRHYVRAPKPEEKPEYRHLLTLVT